MKQHLSEIIQVRTSKEDKRLIAQLILTEHRSDISDLIRHLVHDKARHRGIKKTPAQILNLRAAEAHAVAP